MSETLERIMQLKNMGLNLGMNPQQKRAAQGDAIMRVGAEMGNPHHAGSGFDRLLNVMNASIQPASAAYDQAEQRAMAQNAGEMEMLRRLDSDEQEAKRLKRREMLEERREARREKFDRDKLDLLKENSSKASSYAKESGLTPQMRLWNSLPMNVKNEQIAIGRGMGFQTDVVARRLANGDTLEQMAEEKNLDINEVRKIYAATNSNVAKHNERRSTLAEMDYLEAKTIDVLGDYSRTIFGYSPKQIVEAMVGMNEDKQAKFLAASMILPEVTMARINSMGGSNAVHAIEEARKTMFGDIKIFRTEVSPYVYKKAHEYMHEWLTEGFNIREESLYHIKPKNKDGDSNEKNPIEDLSPEQLLEMHGKNQE